MQATKEAEHRERLADLRAQIQAGRERMLHEEELLREARVGFVALYYTTALCAAVCSCHGDLSSGWSGLQHRVLADGGQVGHRWSYRSLTSRARDIVCI